MKKIFKISLSCFTLAIMLASCKIEEPEQFPVTKPLSVSDMEFLNTYDALKSYIDRSANPNFVLSAAVSIADVTDKGLMYRLISDNFDQVTAVSGLVHRDLVNDVGFMDFGPVNSLLDAASDAGKSVFGPPLVWHANQRGNFLYGKVADEIEIKWELIEGQDDSGEKLVNGDFSDDDWGTSFIAQNGGTTATISAEGGGPGGKGRALIVTNPAVQSQTWGSQFIIRWDKDTPLLTDEEWTFRMDYKSDVNAEYGNQAQNGPGNYKHNDLFPRFSSTPTWQTFESTFVVEARSEGTWAVAFDLGLTATNYHFANVSLIKEPAKTEMLVNGGFEDDDWSANFLKQNQGTAALTPDGQGAYGKGRALSINNDAVRPNSWESQFIIFWDDKMLEGEEWIFSMDYRADTECSIGNQAQNGPGNYMHGGILPNIQLTTAWQTIKHKIVVEARTNNCWAISLDLGHTATTYYFDNVSLIKVGGSKDRWVAEEIRHPKQPEEKVDIITGEMQQWIERMMGASNRRIKDWIVINEPMDDNNPSQLKTIPAVDYDKPPEREFYWHDPAFLGKDYARLAVRYARQYAGNDLKLFVNDYGLLNEAKCRGLINMIKYWEQDGTKIDGISTPLNLTCSFNATTQAQNEADIVKMFTLLAESGKLIRISSFEMKIADAGERNAREQQLAMSKYYNFVIRKYFEIIPAANRYGIAINPVESSSNAGLWDNSTSNSRKFTFSGVADGLAGQNVKHE